MHSESCIEIKTQLNFYFHTSLWLLNIKPFEAPQRSAKTKILIDLFLRPGLGREGLTVNKKALDGNDHVM